MLGSPRPTTRVSTSTIPSPPPIKRSRAIPKQTNTPLGDTRKIWDLKTTAVAPQRSPCSVVPLKNFDWVAAEATTMAHTIDDAAIGGEFRGLMVPRGRARQHPAGPMLLQYARDGCPVEVGRRWSKTEITAAAERGPHASALIPEAIKMMHAEVEAKVKEGYAEVVYLDEVEHLLETEEWGQLKISPIAMIPHKSRKFRAILDLSFELKVHGITIPYVNAATTITAPQYSMRNLGSVLPRLIAAVAAAPLHDGAMVFSKLDIKDGFWRMVGGKQGAKRKIRSVFGSYGNGYGS